VALIDQKLCRVIERPWLSGPASAYGSIGKVQAAYIRIINEQGGVNGRKINLIQVRSRLQSAENGGAGSQARRKRRSAHPTLATTIASSSSDSTVDLGCVGPVRMSATELRPFHLRTVFWLTP
jgi:hypothetical protein